MEDEDEELKWWNKNRKKIKIKILIKKNIY